MQLLKEVWFLSEKRKCQGYHVCYFLSLSLEVSVYLFFLQIFLFRFCCFLFVLKLFLLVLQLLAAVIRFPFIFLCIFGVLELFYLINPQCRRVLFLFLFLTPNLSRSFLKSKALFIVINFLVLWFFCLSFFLEHLKNGPEYLYSFEEISTAEFEFEKIFLLFKGSHFPLFFIFVY